MKFMQKRRLYVRLWYDMFFFLTKCQLLSEFNAVIAVHRPWLTSIFQSFDKPCLVDFLRKFV